MNLALLGDDAESSILARAAEAAGHAIVWREAAAPDEWETLLDASTADAILVGPADGAAADLRARQMVELARQGRPLLAVHPVVPSVLSYFEIDLARGDGGAPLQHYNPTAELAGADELQRWIREGHPTAGPVEQVVATRRLAQRARGEVLRWFARDVELLARLVGRCSRIGAHASGAEGDTAYASLSVQLSGPSRLPARWSVEPPAGPHLLEVALICERGRVTLASAADGTSQWIEPDGAGQHFSAGPAADGASRAVARLAEAVAVADGASSSWPAALDAMELADSIEISLRRGRMIDVHHRELTEQLAFKGVMSAVGCGVLVALVPLAIVVGWLAGVVKAPLADYWPHALLATLALFLAVQLLPKLLSPDPRRGSPPRSDPQAPPAANDQADSAD